jgi:hypothetical protein
MAEGASGLGFYSGPPNKQEEAERDEKRKRVGASEAAERARSPLLPEGEAPTSRRSRSGCGSPEPPVPAATNLVLISDPGQDLDDEMGLIMCRHLIESHGVNLVGVVCTLAPSFDRARLCRGTLDMLGLHHVPVGIGTDGGDTKGVHSAGGFERLASSYLPGVESESTATLLPGRSLLHTLYQGAAPGSLTLVVMAGVQWPPVSASEPPQDPPEDSALLTPDDAHNNQFDRAASEFFYSRCQRLGLPLVIVSRWAAYAVQVRPLHSLCTPRACRCYRLRYHHVTRCRRADAALHLRSAGPHRLLHRLPATLCAA